MVAGYFKVILRLTPQIFWNIVYLHYQGFRSNKLEFMIIMTAVHLNLSDQHVAEVWIT